MSTTNRLVLAIVLLGLVGGSSIAYAASGYSLSVTGSVDTPQKTISHEGQSFTVSAIGAVQPGEEIHFSTDVPSGTDYSVYLYNGDREIVDTFQLTGDASASFPTEGYEPGSYLLVINGPDGNYRALHPVVIAGYTVQLSQDSGETIHTGESVTFTVDLQALNPTEQIDHVEVVISTGSSYRTVTASQTSDGTYTVTTTFESPGTFDVYANVRGVETVDDRKEVLGLAPSRSLTVSDQTPTQTPTPTDAGDATGDQSPDESSTATRSPTPTVTDTPIETSTMSPTPTDTATQSASPTATTSNSASSPTATSSESNVITPGDDGSNAMKTSTTGSLGPLVSVIALCLAILTIGKSGHRP